MVNLFWLNCAFCITLEAGWPIRGPTYTTFGSTLYKDEPMGEEGAASPRELNMGIVGYPPTKILTEFIKL